ncbi:toll-like receptor 7 [Bombina bombina]|uniref:toll-like receptor 7 n=1 Tax=Bombina bombina TaxID=8345 RepID=UPI00235AB33F|nr:toll-like receptor 7 [Bombina bombina]
MLCYSQTSWRTQQTTALILILSIYTISAIIPRFLPCDDYKNGSVVICSQRNLTHVPHIHSMNVTELNLSKNEITLLANHTFSGLPNLKVLNVSGNCLPQNLRPDKKECTLTIEVDSLVNLKYLQILDLNGNSLTSIPPLPKNIKRLYLNWNRILFVSEWDFYGLHNFNILEIGWNCYYRNECGRQLRFADNAFKDTPSLYTLVLSQNNISSFPHNLPSSLVKLDLSENKMWKIDREDLCNLTNLQILNVQWNCQRCDHAAQRCFPCSNNSALQLGPGVFDSLHNLEKLYLRGNSLHTLNDSLFDNLSNLTNLYLSDNYLNLENETFFSKLTNLNNLYLDFNYRLPVMYERLNLNPSVAKMKSLRKISISGYFFNVLDEKGIRPLLSLPNLETVIFRANFILKVNLSMFFSHKNLQSVSLAENLVSFQDICGAEEEKTRLTVPILYREDKMVPEWVNFQGIENNNDQGSKYAEYEDCLMYNKSVDLSFNNIGSLHPDDFIGMEDIECLNMSYNYINQRLNGSQFGHLNSLRHLDLSNNRFDLYYKAAFSDLSKLKVLNLAHNEYQFLMRGVNHRLDFLEQLTSLTDLNLNNNQIGLRITAELKNPSLKRLLFKNNKLGSLWKYGEETYFNIFTNLKKLQVLDISFNQLLVIPHTVLENLPESLQNLTVSNNLLYSFHWDNIAHLKNLIHLDLSFNCLPSPTSNITSIESKVVYLNLKSNQISNLNKYFFLSYTKLRYLILSKNRIKKIDENSFPKPLFSSLVSLDVSENPFQCNCTAYWFIEFLKRTNVTVKNLSTKMVCDSPDILRGKSLLKMNPQSCQDFYGNYCFICTSLLITMWMLITIMWNLFLWDLWYTGQVLMASILSYTKLPGNSKHEFDAFIVFNTKDSAVTDWVYHELVKQLEGPEIGSFNLCLEERDWIAGKSTIENLYEAIYKSKKTVFILNREWLNCGILRHAIFMSHQRLLDEKKDVVVLVILDQKMKMSRYLLTRKRMCPKSFLSWPGNPKAHNHFWHNLRVLLRKDNPATFDPHLQKHIYE